MDNQVLDCSRYYVCFVCLTAEFIVFLLLIVVTRCDKYETFLFTSINTTNLNFFLL